MKGQLLFAILGVILLQSAFTVATPTFEARALGDVLEELLNKVQDLMNEWIDKMQESVNEIVNAVNKFITDQLKKLDEFVLGAWQAVKNFAKEAEQLGIDVSECIDANNEIVNNFKENMSADYKNCSDFHRPEITKAIEDAQKKINAAYDEVVVLFERFDDCGLNPFCLAQLAIDVTAAALRIPTEIASAGLAATETIYKKSKDITKCNNDVADKYAAEMDRIVQETEDCIQKKIDEHATSTTSTTSTTVAPPPAPMALRRPMFS